MAVGILFALLGCQRSPSFKKDQGIPQDDAPPSGSAYYDKGQAPIPSTTRIERMGQPKKRVTVLNFWNDTPVKIAELGDFAALELKRFLFATQRMIVPTDAKSDKVTEDFVQGDSVKVGQLIREGRKLGVSVLIIGRVTKIIFRSHGDEVGIIRSKQSIAGVDVEIKIFDIQSGREMMATARSAEATSNAMVAVDDANMESREFRAELTKLAVRNAVTLLVPDIVKTIEKMAWQGGIAKIIGSKIYINAGRSSGLVAGDILKVLTPGEEIYDPSTGAYLGRSQGQLKGTVEILDFMGADGAVSELHTGGNFQEGDMVRLY
jgi:hypothetical protein